MKITKKKAFKHFKKHKRCPCGPTCGWALRRTWLSKKFGYLLERYNNQSTDR